MTVVELMTFAWPNHLFIYQSDWTLEGTLSLPFRLDIKERFLKNSLMSQPAESDVRRTTSVMESGYSLAHFP